MTILVQELLKKAKERDEEIQRLTEENKRLKAGQPALGKPVAYANENDLKGSGFDFTVTRDGPDSYNSVPLYTDQAKEQL